MQDSFSRPILVAAAISGALAVLIGAFGAHALGSYLDGFALEEAIREKRVETFDLGARYHLVHSVVLLALSFIPCANPRAKLTAAMLILLGILLFSGSLYLLVLLNQTKLGMITPLGGMAWIFGWGTIALMARPK